MGEKSIKRTNSLGTYLGNSSFEERQACKHWIAFDWIKYCFACKKLFGCGEQCPCSPHEVNPHSWSLCWTDHSKQISWFVGEQCGVPQGFLLCYSCQLQTLAIGYNILPLKKPESEVLCLYFHSMLQNSVVKICILRIERCDDKNVYWLTLQKLLPTFLTLLPVVWEKKTWKKY